MEGFLPIWQALIVVAEVIGGILAFLAPLVIIGRWILSPIDRAAKSRKAPVRFSISDFLCLFLAIQIPLAAAYRFIDYEDTRPYWIFFTITWIVGPLVWYCCARTLSKARVIKGSHRFVFMGLIMPLVYYGFLPFLFLTLAIYCLMIGVKSTLNEVQPTWFVWLWFILATLFWLSGMFTHYMVNFTRRDDVAPAVAEGHAADADPLSV